VKIIATPEQDGYVSSEIVFPLITLVKEKLETCCANVEEKTRISGAMIGNLGIIMG
jgi:hypothetical protein